MCHEPDSLPPIPRIYGAAVSHEDLVLESRRRKSFRGVRRRARRAKRRGIVDAAGHPRPLSLLRGARASLRRARPQGGRDRLLRPHGRRRQARRRLRVHAARRADDRGWRPGRHTRRGGVAAYGRVPFGLHGRLLLRRAEVVARGSVGALAGGRDRLLRRPGAVRRFARADAACDRARCPDPRAEAGDDPGIPVEDSQAFDHALDEAGVEHEVVIYPGAPHSFFDRKYEEFADASADAWSRVLAFVERHDGGSDGWSDLWCSVSNRGMARNL